MNDSTILENRVDRREAMSLLLGGLAAGSAAVGACSPLTAATPEERERKILEWEQSTQKHYRSMTAEERAETVQRRSASPSAPRALDAIAPDARSLSSAALGGGDANSR